MKRLKKLLLLFAAIALILPAVHSFAEAETGPDASSPPTVEEIKERIGELAQGTELPGWESYFERLRSLSGASGFASVNQFIEALAEDTLADGPDPFIKTLSELLGYLIMTRMPS